MNMPNFNLQSFEEITAKTNQNLRDNGKPVLTEDENIELLLAYTNFKHEFEKVDSNTIINFFDNILNNVNIVKEPLKILEPRLRNIATSYSRQADIRNALPNFLMKDFFPIKQTKGIEGRG